ncbi:endonuclease/exonuclease/phosphatase family protein [Nocardioides sp. GCM10027113]|uniref:endonuclease/exonuclease/phosphatase family protein n=1 Tax=unclassified Nocardioides TaxID=2615069 RepID=UPI0036208038
MRIGTWNLAGRSTDAHVDLLLGLDCDVLLLTEVSEALDLPGYHRHVTATRMAPRRRWAGVLARRDLAPLPDPHPASAAVRVGGLTVCSTVLPWRTCGAEPWGLGNHGARTRLAVETLLRHLPRTGLVWGGDWNHSLSGVERAGSAVGRKAVLGALEQWGLVAPTAELDHQIDGQLSIDHVAVPSDWSVTGAERIRADALGSRLSDHDAYVVEVVPATVGAHLSV